MNVRLTRYLLRLPLLPMLSVALTSCGDSHFSTSAQVDRQSTRRMSAIDATPSPLPNPCFVPVADRKKIDVWGYLVAQAPSPAGALVTGRARAVAVWEKNEGGIKRECVIEGESNVAPPEAGNPNSYFALRFDNVPATARFFFKVQGLKIERASADPEQVYDAPALARLSNGTYVYARFYPSIPVVQPPPPLVYYTRELDAAQIQIEDILIYPGQSNYGAGPQNVAEGDQTSTGEGEPNEVAASEPTSPEGNPNEVAASEPLSPGGTPNEVTASEPASPEVQAPNEELTPEPTTPVEQAPDEVTTSEPEASEEQAADQVTGDEST